MPSYAVDSAKQQLVATGIVTSAHDWVEGADGKRSRAETQARDEATGMPLWEVEVVMRTSSWGRESTVTGRVTVGALDEPAPGFFSPITFAGLVVQVRVAKATGALIETWTAESIEAVVPLGGTGGSDTRSGSSSPAAKAA